MNRELLKYKATNTPDRAAFKQGTYKWHPADRSPEPDVVIREVPALGNVRDVLQELFPGEHLRCLLNVLENKRWFREPEQLRTYYWFDLNNREVAHWQEWALQNVYCWSDKTRRVWSPDWMKTLHTVNERWSIIPGFEYFTTHA